MEGVIDGSTIFFCINTTCRGAWGTLPKLMKALFDLELEAIDHRSWSPRYDDTVVDEIYCKADVKGGTDLDEYIQIIFDKLTEVIGQQVRI